MYDCDALFIGRVSLHGKAALGQRMRVVKSILCGVAIPNECLRSISPWASAFVTMEMNVLSISVLLSVTLTHLNRVSASLAQPAASSHHNEVFAGDET